MRQVVLVPIVAAVTALLATSGVQRGLGWPAVQRAIQASHPRAVPLSGARLAAWQTRPDTVQPVLLDVRAAEEYAVSHLLGARLTPGLPSAMDTLAAMPRDTAIVLYCAVGYRSAAVAEALQDSGYANVWNLTGSIFQWVNEGRPVYRGAEQVHVVHPYSRAWSLLLKPHLAADPGVGAAARQEAGP